MIVGMHEHVGHMHDMQMICMSETCGPPRHAISVTILLVSCVNYWKASKSIAIFTSVILIGV